MSKIEPTPIKNWRAVQSLLSNSECILADLLYMGGHYTPSEFYDEMDNLYESLQAVDDQYSEEAAKLIEVTNADNTTTVRSSTDVDGSTVRNRENLYRLPCKESPNLDGIQDGDTTPDKSRA